MTCVTSFKYPIRSLPFLLFFCQSSIMSSYLKTFYHLVYDEFDPRTKDWLLVSGPGPLMIILLSYIYFCTFAGPKYMKNKPPYSLRTPMIIYNFTQVLLSIYLVYEALMAAWLFNYSYTCEPVDYSNTPTAMRVARGVHLYFMCKIMELLDTVFFVLRKKQRQISFLHLYHHAAMPLVAWLGARYFPGGHPTFLGSVNSFVHIFMYIYYMMTAINPEIQKNVRLKKSITTLQLVQFFIIALHSGQMLFNDCNFPKILSLAITLQSVMFVYLFTRFYIHNYIRIEEDRTGNNAALSNGRTRSKID